MPRYNKMPRPPMASAINPLPDYSEQAKRLADSWIPKTADGVPMNAAASVQLPPSTIKSASMRPVGSTVSNLTNPGLGGVDIGALPAGRKGSKLDFNLGDLGDGIKKIAPYASNIINAFRRPPAVKAPHLDSEIGAQHISMDNDRAQIERGVRGADMATDRNLDENTAAAVKMNTLGVRSAQLNAVNAAERNTNIGIDNDNARLNAGIRAGNNNKLDNFDNAGIERGLAIQRESSANFANAADKYIGIQNEQAKNDLELKKFGILESTDYRGVLGRHFDESGNPIRKKAMGGSIKAFNSKRMYPAMK